MDVNNRVGWVRWLGIGIILTFLMIPVLFIIPLSFTGVASFVFPPPSWSNRWWINLIEDPRWGEAAWLSFKIAVVATLLTTTIGTIAAYAMARSKGRWVSLFRTFVILPQVVPVVVVGIGVMSVFLRLQLVGTFLGFVLVHSALAMPFVVIPVAAAISKVDSDLERASAILGASPPTTFLRVILPLISPSILAGAYFSFSLSFSELVVSLFIFTSTFRTLPVFVWQQITDSTNPTVAVLGTIQISIVWTFLFVKFIRDFASGRLNQSTTTVYEPTAIGSLTH